MLERREKVEEIFLNGICRCAKLGVGEAFGDFANQNCPFFSRYYTE
jgi:hypothetical protein